jgi:hypothetical protein
MRNLACSALGIGAVAACLAGCEALRQGPDDLQPPIGASDSMRQGPATSMRTEHGRRHPVAHPTYLFFYSPHPLKFLVRQTRYHGRFTMSDPACRYIATVSPKSAKGPRATFKVTPIKSPSGGVCVVSVADAQGHEAKVTVSNPGY